MQVKEFMSTTAQHTTSSNPVCAAIPKERIEEIWSLVAPFLCLVIEYNNGEYAIDDLKAELIEGQQQLFIMHENGDVLAAITAEIIRYPQKTVCGLVAAGGSNLHEWLDEFMSIIIPVAKEQGAEELRITGRGGWEKVMKPYGFEKTHTILARTI